MIRELQEAGAAAGHIWDLHKLNRERAQAAVPVGTLVRFEFRQGQQSWSVGCVVNHNFDSLRIRFGERIDDYDRKVVDIPFHRIHGIVK